MKTLIKNKRNRFTNCGGKRCGSAFEWHGKEDVIIVPVFVFRGFEIIMN
jgi:hypothetical protein